MWLSLETTPKTITVAGNFVFITLGTLNRPDLHFEGAGNGTVVITWIGREHELYSSAWNLYTIGQLRDGRQQKKKTGFH